MDEITPEQIRLWADQYLKGIISPEDKVSFERWYNEMPEEAIEWGDKKVESAEALRTQTLRAIHKRIKARGFTSSITRRVILLRRVAAAILILLAVGAGGYWMHFGKTQPEPMVISPVTHDLQPGGNKAILTLSNGKRIILDSTNNGHLVSQGNSQVKVDSGLLAYAPLKAISNGQSEVFFNTLTTPRGGQYRLILPDGTQVWLNAASSIRYPTIFTGKERIVEVTGEAYFEVAKNAKAPFKVLANNLTISVLGTHFNIMAYKDEATSKVTLLEGKVNVIQGDKHILLAPGEQAQLDQNGQLAKVEDVDLSGVISWTNNQFWFDNADIQTVMRQISRWYNVDVVIKGDIPEHFTGYIPRNVTVSKIFEVLQQTNLIHFSIEDKKIIASP